MPESENSSPFTDNALARIALLIWQDDTCREGLLHWQDTYQADINLCLCLSWLEGNNRAPDNNRLQGLLAISADFQRVLQPLRAARRGVKQVAADLYAIYTDLELQTEYKELADLFEFSQNDSLLAAQPQSFDPRPGDPQDNPRNSATIRYLQHLGVTPNTQDQALAARLMHHAMTPP